MSVVYHDAFAREELHRERVRTMPGRTCDQCGWVGRNGRLYAYFYTRDDATRTPLRRTGHVFCGINCCRAYHEPKES